MAKFDIFAVFRIEGDKEVTLAFKRIQSQANKLGRDLQKVGQDAKTFGRNLVIGATAIGAAIASTVDDFTEYEDAAIGVRKVTNLSAEEFEQLKGSVKDLSVELATTQAELFNITAAAGRLGIDGVDNLAKFTKTGAQLAVAVEDLDPADAITALNGLIITTGEGQENVDRLGAALTALGNNAGTTEQQILEVSREVNRSGALFNLGSAQVLGLSTAFAELQLQPQQARAVLSRFFIEANRAIREGGDELQKFAYISGVSVDEFTKNFQQDALGTFFAFSENLGLLADNGSALEQVLQDTGLASQGSSAAFAQLATNAKLIKDRVDLATQSFAENTALQQEFIVRTGALSFVLDQAKVAFNNLNISAAQQLAPGLATLSQAFQAVLEIIEPTIQGIFGELNTQLLAFAENIRKRAAEDPEFFRKLITDFVNALKLFIEQLINVSKALKELGQLVLGLANFFTAGNAATATWLIGLAAVSGAFSLILSTGKALISFFKTLQALMIGTGLIAEGKVAISFTKSFAAIAAASKTAATVVIGRMAAIVSAISISNILAVLGTAFRLFWAAVTGPVGIIVLIASGIALIIAKFVDWRAVIDSVKAAWDKVLGVLAKALDFVRSIFGFSGKKVEIEVNENRKVTQTESGQGFATGGLVRGAGTSTSDSIMARLSNGEYVVNAASVRKFGVDFLNRINSGVLPRIKGFADGGLVGALDGMASNLALQPAPAVSIAGNTQTSSGRPINLVIPGAGTFTGMFTEDVAQRLQRSLRSADLKKSADKPEWVR